MPNIRELTMSHWMFVCKDVSERVSKSMDQPIPLHERMMIAFHLMMCKYCRRFKKQLLILRYAVRSVEIHRGGTEESISLPGNTRERIKQTVRNALSDSI